MFGCSSYYDPYGQPKIKPKNIMEHLQILRWYNEIKIAEFRLNLVAQHIDDPQWIIDKEEEWLNEPEYWNGYYGKSEFGAEWE